MTSYYERETAGWSGQPIECYKFLQPLPDAAANIWRFTSCDVDVSIPDGTYTPEGISRGRMSFSQETATGAVEIYMSLASPIAALFATQPSEWPISVTIFRAHRGDEMDTKTIFVGKLSSVRFENEQAVIGCKPITAQLERRIPNISFQTQCAWNLYGVGCDVNKSNANFFVAGALSAIADGLTLTAPQFASKPNGWFNNGFVVNTATSQRRFIVAHSFTIITISLPFLPALPSGAGVTAFAGCDRTEAVCATKFNNLEHHLGFPRMPLINPHIKTRMQRRSERYRDGEG